MSPGREARRLMAALQFLTRLPTPPLADVEDDIVTRAARYFPLVGQVVGLICAAVWITASQVWPGLPAAVLAIGAGVLVTGGLHEDGLADTADGLGGGRTRAEKLAILKDSRVGTFGALALIIMLALKTSLLARLTIPDGALGLILAHGVARAAAVVGMAALPYAGDPAAAKIKPAPGGVSWREASAALALAAWPLAFAGWRGVGAMAAAMGLALALGGYARRTLGGVTGDVLGAIEQVAEVGFLLGLAACR